ncbi:hypothetical protein LOZ01_003093 [Ophidiomyces ophidiicola]|nr:hypothetical protein LOZ01_003093 [Ophidiomyces ophidiicola]
MGFWVDWQLWEKMCFVLGCLIAIVLVYGTCVQLYNRWRIKKMAAKEKELKLQQEPTSEAVKDDDIPFGTRAMESGIEIEGIWISNPNSPLPSPHPPGTPAQTRPPSTRSTEMR